MVQLSRNSRTKKFHVGTLAKNTLTLNTTEANGLATKKGAIKNIRSVMVQYNSVGVLVQDNTGRTPVVLHVGLNAISRTDIKPGRPYIPGKKKKH